ncbi:MAG: LemA family protein [Atopobiaceae bacterium]|nr:LemA family protein [Atopobiaceae bacterium]
MSPIIVVIILLVVVIGVCISLYNKIVTLRNRVDNAWQTIDTQLQRRNDLIPNLVETVKGYMVHEASTLAAVTEARAAAVSASSPEAKMAAANDLSGALSRLIATFENYPDLKANANFQQLQSDLTDTENRISYARQSFNDCVMMFNNAIQTFPGNVIASMAGFEPRMGFEATDAARFTPNVQF